MRRCVTQHLALSVHSVNTYRRTSRFYFPPSCQIVNISMWELLFIWHLYKAVYVHSVFVPHMPSWVIIVNINININDCKNCSGQNRTCRTVRISFGSVRYRLNAASGGWSYGRDLVSYWHGQPTKTSSLAEWSNQVSNNAADSWNTDHYVCIPSEMQLKTLFLFLVMHMSCKTHELRATYSM